MSAITLKNIPSSLHRQLKFQAKLNHRSLNQEILVRLETPVVRKPIDVANTLKQARALRSRMKGLLTSEELDQAINEGRP